MSTGPLMERDMTWIAQVDLAADRVVVQGSTGNDYVNVPGAADAGSIIGVTQEARTAGNAIAVRERGVALADVGTGGVTKGSWVIIADTAGKVKDAVTNATPEMQNAVGRARETVAAGGKANIDLQPCMISQ